MNDQGEEKVNKQESDDIQGFASTAELKTFLLSVRDRMSEDAAAHIFAATAMKHVLSLSNIYDLFDEETKEIARDIWLRIKQSGMHLKSPPFLFSEEA